MVFPLMKVSLTLNITKPAATTVSLTNTMCVSLPEPGDGWIPPIFSRWGAETQQESLSPRQSLTKGNSVYLKE